MTREEVEAHIAATAARVKAGGVPDFLNVWLGMTPERLAESELTRERLRQGPHRVPETQWTERPMQVGPKEQALRAMRQGKTAPAPQGNPAAATARPDMPKATAPAQPATAEAAQHEETDMKTATKTKARSKAKGKTTARRPKGASKAAARNTARATAPGGVREGSKLAAIVGLLQRPGGCTSADVLKATEWPSVSMPQQAKAAGITLVTEKEGRVTRYWDKATKPEAKKAD
jgi:hypothetical protein